MREFKLTTTVAADPEQVWALVGDFPGYPAWHPLVERLKVDTHWSTRLRVLLRLGRRVRLSGSLVEVNPPRRLSWDGAHPLWGLLRVRYRLLVVPADEGSTVVQTVAVGGLLPTIAPRTLSSLPDALAETAHALKHAVERRVPVRRAA